MRYFVVAIGALMGFLGASQTLLAQCQTAECLCESNWGCDSSLVGGLQATASSEFSDATAARLALDRDEHTSWIARGGSMPQSLEVSLPAGTEVCGVKISFERRSRWRYDIELSADRQQWQRVVTVDGSEESEKVFNHQLERTATQYIRLNVTGSTDGSWAGIAELQVSQCCSLIGNKEPVVVPRLRQWIPSTGSFNMTAVSAIVLASPEDLETVEAASTFAEDIEKMFGRALPLVYRSPVAGDFAFALDTNVSTQDEGYSLDIGDVVTLRSRNALGLIHGSQTILQILTQQPTHQSLPKGRALDGPSFSWRGLMLDGGRKYWEMDFLRKWIRLLGWYKMNVFHWHLSDGAAFRFGSTAYPGLADERHYSGADIDEIVALGKKYGVMIIPEIDVPAHADPLLSYEPRLDLDHDRQVDVSSSFARSWLEVLFDEVQSHFPAPYFHIGGDEFTASIPIDSTVEFFNYFADRFAARGKRMIVWNGFELQRPTVALNPNVLVDFWYGYENGYFLSRGYNIINNISGVYVVPRDNNQWSEPNLKDMYEGDLPTAPRFAQSSADNIVGSNICVWADNSLAMPDAFFEPHFDLGARALAEVLWGTRSGSLDCFLHRLRKVSVPSL